MNEETRVHDVESTEIGGGTAGSAFSCRRFLGYAIALSAFFLIAHLAGWREYTAALSGTGASRSVDNFFGMVYVLLYVCVVGCVPILLIGSLVTVAIQARRRRKSSDMPNDGSAVPGSDPGPSVD